MEVVVAAEAIIELTTEVLADVATDVTAEAITRQEDQVGD